MTTTITLRVDDDIHRRLSRRARMAGVTLSEMLKPAIEEVVFPGGRYVFTGQDELLTVALQTFALVAELAGERSGLVERGTANARLMLRERGLLTGEGLPDAEAVRSAPGAREGGR